MSVAQNVLQPSSYVGFDTITTQIEHRLLKRGFQFNILVAGKFYKKKLYLSINLTY